jgi:hypothetical protein
MEKRQKKRVAHSLTHSHSLIHISTTTTTTTLTNSQIYTYNLQQNYK